MTLREFESEFSKLKEKWARYYTPAMEAEAFIAVESSDAQAFESFIKKQLWRKQGDPPNLSDFQNFARKSNVAESLHLKFNECQHCDGYGNFVAIDTRTLTSFGYECDTWFACIYCRNGQEQAKAIKIKEMPNYNPFWNPRWLEHGYRLKFRSPA